MTKDIMKKTFQFKAIAFLALALFVSTFASAQTPMKKAPASPRDSVSGMISKATVSINYGAPSVKGRKVFSKDGLQPFDKMWRAGANQATTLVTDKDIKVEGKTLPAGKYTLFITPSEGEWTVTINSETGQWGIKRNGDANEDPAKDVVVAKVKAKTAPFTETLKFAITKKGFSMMWENTELPVSVK